MKEQELKIYKLKNVLCYDGDYFYVQSRKRTKWNSPCNDIENKVYFLNQFKCRLPSNDDFFNKLADRIKPIETSFSALMGIRLEDTDLEDNIFIDGHTFTISTVIENVHKHLSYSIPHFGDVASTKFMHMTCPNLLVMVDSDIGSYLKKGGVTEKYFSTTGYIDILKFIKGELLELIEDIGKNRKLTKEEAIRYISHLDEHALLSLPRLLEKHFYGSSRS